MGRVERYANWAEYEWANPPAPFNPDFDPDWKKKEAKVRAYVEAREPLATREERRACREEAIKIFYGDRK